MQVPDDITIIPPTKIAVEEQIDIEAYRKVRKLQALEDESDLVYFARDDIERFYERMRLIDALEVKITPADPENAKKLEFNWDITAYSPDYLYLQLIFKNPEELSNSSQLDTVSVTFWGVDYFKSYQNKEVQFGTTLEWPIFRQVDKSEKEAIDVVSDDILTTAYSITLFLILPTIIFGSLLPTWMFINSLQIITHMALLKTMMPGNAHYFLAKYLEWLRWYNRDLVLWLD